MKTMNLSLKIGVVLLILISVSAYLYFDLGAYLHFQALKDNQNVLKDQLQQTPVTFIAWYCAIYILVTALSIPGATIMTLAGGALFGLWQGTLIVSFASTIGATLAFLVARFLLRDYFEQKWAETFKSINRGIEKEGIFYLFTLRLIPAVPFFLVNILMGLTQISVVSFFVISQIGMLAGTLVYVNAGTQLAQIESPKDILSFEIIVSFALLGLFPLMVKKAISFFKKRKFLSPFKKPKTFDYNMVVIGAGSAGLVSSYIASAVKAKVALIEKHKMGGDCLNTGCVPSKALIRSAKIVNDLRRAEEFGLEKISPTVHFTKVMERVQKVIREIEPHDSVERYTKLGVECIHGEATILSPYEVAVNGRVLTTKNIVIATGARPFVPPLKGLNDVPFLTSDTIWSLKELPKKLVVLGGGPIGCELAQSFARLGSEVTLIERSYRLLAREDHEVSEIVKKKFVTESIQVLTDHNALEVQTKKDRFVLVCEHQQKSVEVEFTHLLVALGRKANVTGFGLENLNVELTPQGTIATNEFLQTTNYDTLFACGDVAGPYQFTHTASHQAWYVAVNALFRPFKKYRADYRVIPWCTFTDPEVARVGLSEAEAQEQNIPYKVTTYGIDDLDRAIVDGNAHGFVKVLTRPGSDQILGVTIVGSHAGDIIAEYVTAMKYGLGLNKILGTIHIYPTLSEANKYAAGVWKRETAPQSALRWLEKYHAWRRG